MEVVNKMVSVDDRLPVKGDYLVVVVNNGQTAVTSKPTSSHFYLKVVVIEAAIAR